MEFGFTPEQEAFRASLREWTRRTLTPAYLERSRAAVFPRELYKELGELGVLGILAPEAAGGQGADHVTAGIAAEEIAYGDFSCSFFVLAALVAFAAVDELGSDDAKAWGRRAIAGDAVVALALSESEAGSDLANVSTRAEKCDGGWRIFGEKSSISLASAADAALVLARTSPDGGARGTGLFLVPLDSPAVSRQSFEDPGFRMIGRGSLTFEGVLVPDSMKLGSEDRGFHSVMPIFEFTRAFIGLMCVGCAQASMDEAGAYATTRTAFGRPIAKNQGVAFPIAEHDTYLRAARLLSYEALWRRDRGLPHTREAAAAKWFAPKAAFEAAHEALLLHGSLGYTAESPFAQRMLDIMSCEIGDGTAQIQKSVIARELLGRDFRPY